MVGTGPQGLIDGTLGPAEKVHPVVEDGHHVRAQEPPGETQGEDQDDDGEGETHLEPLGLEHGDAEVDEHRDGDLRAGCLERRSYPLQGPDEAEHQRCEQDDAQ